MDLVKGPLCALALFLWTFSVIGMFGMVDTASAAAVTQLDLTGAATNWSGPQGRMLDRLLDQDGTILIGSYQALGQIVDPITKGHKTFSLFTSGMTGAPPPSAAISGNSITVDLSSLFFGWQRGDQVRAWNIGGQATGLFNPQTSEFSISWDHLFNNRDHEHNSGTHHKNGNLQGAQHTNGHVASFFLTGTAMLDGAAPVAIPASLYLYATGAVGLGSWSWWRRRQLTPAAS